MKKPRKPKAKRPATRPGPAPAARAPGGGKAALGSAAQAFLARPQAATRTPPATASRSAAPARGPLALGPAARAFLGRPTPASLRPTPVARSSAADSFDQRELVTLLLMPFFLLAFALGMSQTWRQPLDFAEPVPIPSKLQPASLQVPQRPAMVELAPPVLRLPPGPPAVEVPEVRLAAPALRLPPVAPEIAAPEFQLPRPLLALPAAPPTFPIELPAPMLALPAAPPAIAAPEIEVTAPLRLPRMPPPVEPPEIKLAAPIPQLPSRAPPIPAPPGPAVCHADSAFGAHVVTARPVAPGEDFGARLAAAAAAQIGGLVVYNDKYQRIAYPMGDVAPFFGVCTDVIIRAYRALGVDLQQAVAEARVGSGDTSIQHRRTETLRRFLASRGESLPVTAFPENYQPGDIVTYHRPQNRASRSHIAIVSDRIAPSGRPMIVHNRGWGPQLEDALFVDRITGHYRYRPVTGTAVAAAPRKPAPAQSRPLQKAAYTVPARGP